MEINITEFVKNADPSEFSASRMEKGDNAGEITWDNAMSHAGLYDMIDTDEQQAAFRDSLREFGAWADSEIDGWDFQELNAIFIQLISGDLREAQSLASDDDGEIDWDEYERLSSAGRVSGNLFRADDGSIYHTFL